MEQKFKVRLIVSDVEGCITPPDRGIMIPAELTAIAAYCEAARKDKNLPPLVLCTGRQIPYAECVAQLIGAFFPKFPSIVENGAFLYDIASNEITLNPLMNPDAYAALQAVREEAERVMKKHGARKEYGKDACISLNPPPNMAIERFFEIVREALAHRSQVVEITHSKSAVDITPAGIDKAAGVRYLAERVGIPPEEMLGIGDSRGDLPMLKLVGVPTGPANATEEVREIAKFIAPQPGPVGLAEILRQFTAWR